MLKLCNNSKELTLEEQLKLVMEISQTTIGFDIKPLAFEDIPIKIEELCSKALSKNVTIEGHPLLNGVLMKVEND